MPKSSCQSRDPHSDSGAAEGGDDEWEDDDEEREGFVSAARSLGSIRTPEDRTRTA